MTASDTQSFINTYLNDARIAAGQLGIPTSVILAQWINETGSGTSSAFQQGNNFAGVSNNGKVDSFPDKRAGLIAYIQRWQNPVYAPTIAAIQQDGNVNADPIAAARLVENSPWAAGHYGGTGLEDLITNDNLAQYDKLGTLQPGQYIQQQVNSTQDPGAAGGAGLIGGGGSSGGCPEGNLFSGPSIPLVGSAFNLTRCQGRALLGAASLVAGGILLLVGLGFIGIGSRAGKAVAAPIAAGAALA